MQKLTLSSESERILSLGHPWVIADGVTRRWPPGKDGDLVQLVSERGAVIATALREVSDRVVARVLPGAPAALDSAYLRQQLLKARNLRRDYVALDETDAYRLVNGEGDGLPGLIVDRYADYLLIQLYSAIWQPYLKRLYQALQDVFSPSGIYLKQRPQNTRALESQWKDRGKYGQLVMGTAAPEPLIVEENGLRFQVTLTEGLHTGLFLDQRVNRLEWMQRVKGKRVLNLFSYTGAFSVAAAAAGATRVTSIDASASYMDAARQNFNLNRLNPKVHDFRVGDAFTLLKTLQDQQAEFDLILMDPPAFSTTKKSRFSTRGGTAHIVSLVLPLLKVGGMLISSCNHQKVSESDYLKEIRKGMIDAESQLRVVGFRGQPEDFPYRPSWPEGRYLKYVMSVKES